MKFFGVFVVGFFTLWCTITAIAADFCVCTPSEIANALMTSESNGENDTIRIVQGTYTGIFIYSSGDSNSLTVEGGYTTGCTSRVVDPINTVLDPNQQWSALDLRSTGTTDFYVDGLTLTNGVAKEDKGGGLYCRTNGSITLSNNIIDRNTATGRDLGFVWYEGHGGGAYLWGSSISLINNTITGNFATGPNKPNANAYGGGIFLNYSSAALINNIIIGNSAIARDRYGYGKGGGVFSGYPWNVGTISLINNSITGNSVSGGGANSDKGGGIYIGLRENSNFAEIYNNIIWGNNGDDGADIYIKNDENTDGIRSTVSLYNNDFNQTIPSGFYIQIPIFIDPSNLNNIDPLFIDALNGDYHLQESSPVIDMGDNKAPELPPTDKDGNVRVFDGDDDGTATVDMGAYEYGSHPPLNPAPDIKANDSDDPITISPEVILIVTVSLDPNDMNGEDGDWWVVAGTPFGWYHYGVGGCSWIPGLVVTHQGPLFDLAPREVLNMSGLPRGNYMFYFGVDMVMNGSLDMDQIYYDNVEVNIE